MPPTPTRAKARLWLVLLDTVHSASERTASGAPEAVFFAALNEGERYKWRRDEIHTTAQKGDPVSEKEAIRQLQKMLRSYTIGSVCHLLADAHRKHVEDAGQAGDPVAVRRNEIAQHVLFCIGVGLDSAIPHTR
jgi:hypothetical protein